MSSFTWREGRDESSKWIGRSYSLVNKLESRLQMHNRFYLLSDTVVLNVGNLQQVLTVNVRRFAKKLHLFRLGNEARRNYAASTNILPPSHE